MTAQAALCRIRRGNKASLGSDHHSISLRQAIKLKAMKNFETYGEEMKNLDDGIA